jgi:hypothetical protein
MHALSKNFIRTAAVAIGLSLAGVGAAHAGEWRVNPAKCPDLREDRQDRRHNDGWRDRREDRRDERVINCPARAWYYVPSRGERRGYYSSPRPRDIFVDRRGERYYRDNRGVRLTLRLG